MQVFVFVSVPVYVCLFTRKIMVVFEKSSNEFDIRNCLIKVKVTAQLSNFYLPQYKLSSPISKLCHWII